MTDDALEKTLDSFSLTFAEYAILNLILYESRAAPVAWRYALDLVEHVDHSLGRTELENAIRCLHKRGLVVTVDLATQRQIVAFLRDGTSRGPTDGLPTLGTLDFTLAGALHFRTFLNARFGDVLADYYWTACVSYIYRRHETIVYCSSNDLGDALLHSNLIPAGDLEPIGDWRVEWWRLIPDGYRLRCLPYADEIG